MNQFELFNQPKIFVQRCQEHLTALGFEKPYDYDRFIKEELGELINNHESCAHDNNRTLLVDDIVDSMWVVLAKTGCIEIYLNLYEPEFFDHNERMQVIKEDLEEYFSAIGTLEDLHYIFEGLCLLANMNNIDWEVAFEALCKENFSKLDFPQERALEIFRTGKLNRKDLDGNVYPWVKMTDFSVF